MSKLGAGYELRKTMQLSQSVLNRWSMESLLEHTLASRPELLPAQTIDLAVTHHLHNASSYLEGLLRSDWQISTAEVLFAPKVGEGLRPIPVLGLVERVALEGLVVQLASSVPPVRRSHTHYDEFAKGPLVDGHRDGYVVSADVASFYDYVDHDVLRSEVIAQTGDIDVADDLQRLLSMIMGRRFGLPQGYPASDLLSEMVIDIVERRLVRQGWQCWRFNDDFRIVAPTWRGARQAIEALTRELRTVGLHLSENKLHTRSRVAYRSWAEAPIKRWQEITAEAEVDSLELGSYGEFDGDGGGIDVAAALRVVEHWKRHREAYEIRSALDDYLYRRLVSQAIGTLAITDSEGALPYLSDLWMGEAWLTRKLVKYLSNVSVSAPKAVNRSLEALLGDSRVTISDWQSLYLFQVPIRTQEPSDEVLNWVRERMSATSSDAVRARAAVALAFWKKIDPAECVTIVSTVGAASKPDAVLALAFAASADDDALLGAVQGDGPLYRWTAELAGEGAVDESLGSL